MFLKKTQIFLINQPIETEDESEKLSTTSNSNSDNLNHDISISKNIFKNLLRQKENSKNDN